MPTHTIAFDPGAQADLNKLDPTTRTQIDKALVRLASNPNLGKPLKKPLAGLYSLHAARKRYRIVYDIDTASATITVLAIGARQSGKRSDPYATTRRRA
ncbi:type II toxin-antitoxin system RelE/ParE family toxin [Deinococcus soli (ex Cha et al. 2016)]|uniref:mRNA-degrading endonuclease RelE of RelBE toxin-antitoxin system n=1 Tax=Deinococcus soli (ex Cha et al. 2016) TaxID=1309411 RepID=A0ACC6KN07_9DEIO|nr:type II toxin-antitoxin system RelE/ParE family toxin [Deinococcus soli (ex Cha et al. 2016)]MDR6330645.1 mRNA-degrading endonuclease RelE of RelBE toxin-antitoxin system [Deinococcus soli (ex Cha et al. 2016)]MDR6754012.1 mRNA-degrading endonuclease RelE of RelBE toxin-antitoxin system [Deinococcus soli (ex Cha et al. 2016)]